MSEKVQDQDHLLEFLGNCQILSELEISGRPFLSQSFFDNLSVVCSLNWLTINGDLGLNFSFIFNMQYLRSFETNQEMSSDVISKLGTLFYLETVRFKSNDISISLRSTKGNRGFVVANYLELGLNYYSKKCKPERLAKLLDTMKEKGAAKSGHKKQRTI